MQESEWGGFRRIDFKFEDRDAVLVFPKTACKGAKWLFKTEYFGAFPNFEFEMLKRGYHVASLSNITRWFQPDDAESKSRFCNYLQEQYGLNPKCVPVGMSCGGMHAVYFAAQHPENIAALYLDAPVMNLLSCPCAIGDAENDFYEEFVTDRGMTVSDLINYRNHPVDRIPELIENKIPAFLVCGDSDKTVPYHENGKALAEAYRDSGVPFEEVLKPGCDHHPHGLDDSTPLIEFIEKYYQE